MAELTVVAAVAQECTEQNYRMSGSAFKKAMAEALSESLKKLNPKGRGKQTASIH